MDGRVVERFLSVTDPEKAGTLFKGFRTEFRHFEKLLSGLKAAVFLAVGDNILCHGLCQAGYVLQQRS